LLWDAQALGDFEDGYDEPVFREDTIRLGLKGNKHSVYSPFVHGTLLTLGVALMVDTGISLFESHERLMRNYKERACAWRDRQGDGLWTAVK
jgi:hypothetical protein